MPATEWTSFASPHGEIRAFTATPASAPPWPALICLQGANGLDSHHERLTAEFASQGCYTVSPDLYTHDAVYRQFEPDVVADGLVLSMLLRGQIVPRQIPGLPQDEDLARAFLSRFDAPRREKVARARQWVGERAPESTFVDIAVACFDHLRLQKGRVSRIGAIGYCMGGRFAGELAIRRPELAAAVIYYGLNPGLDRVAGIRCPVQGHYGAADPMITDHVPAFAAAMKAAAKDYSFFIYDASHAFALPPPYPCHEPAATAEAARRTRQFLAAHLGSDRASAG